MARLAAASSTAPQPPTPRPLRSLVQVGSDDDQGVEAQSAAGSDTTYRLWYAFQVLAGLDYNQRPYALCAHSREVIEATTAGSSAKRFQATQQAVTMAS